MIERIASPPAPVIDSAACRDQRQQRVPGATLSSSCRLDHAQQRPGQQAADRVQHQFLLGRPAPVDRGLAGLGPGRHRLDGHAAVAAAGQFGDGGVPDRLLQLGPALALPSGLLGHVVRGACDMLRSGAEVMAGSILSAESAGVRATSCETTEREADSARLRFLSVHRLAYLNRERLRLFRCRILLKPAASRDSSTRRADSTATRTGIAPQHRTPDGRPSGNTPAIRGES